MKARILFTLAMLSVSARAEAQILYQQNFENPLGFVNEGGDINITRTVNQLYGNQPAGFTFTQNFTVETLHIGGTDAFGVGYKDPQARGGSYALGLLSTAQDDQLGLAFNVGAFKFLNFSVDVSSIDLDRFGGPFVPTGGLAPTFRFSLFDNPTGTPGLGLGTALSFADVTGTLSASKFTFDWTNVALGLDATGNTNGNVILRADLLTGGYAAMDNFVVAASNVTGGPTIAPEPSTYAMLSMGLLIVGIASRRTRKR